MLELTVKFSRLVRIVNQTASTEGERLADDLARLMTGQTQIALLQMGKKVTGDTLKSIKWRSIQNTFTFQHRIVEAGAGWRFIVAGRRAGAKMPVAVVGEGPRGGKIFQPLPEMLKWFNALGIPRDQWFPIMRAISIRGIKPTDVPGKAIRNANSTINKYTRDAAARIKRGIIQKV